MAVPHPGTPGHGTVPYGRTADPLVASGFGSWCRIVLGIARRSFGKLALLYLLGLVVTLLLLVGVGSLFDSGDAGTGYDPSTGLYAETGGLGIYLVLRFVLLVLELPVLVLIGGAGCFVVIRDAAGRPAGFGESLRFAAGRLWRAVWWTFVAFLAYFVGVLLLVLPGLYVLIVMSVLSGVLFVERGNLGRCFSLVNRSFLTAVGRFLCLALPGLAYLLVTMVVLNAAGVGSGTAVGITLQLVVGLPLGVLWFAAVTATYAELRGRERPGVTAETLADELAAA